MDEMKNVKWPEYGQATSLVPNPGIKKSIGMGLILLLAIMAGCTPVNEYVHEGEKFARIGDWDSSVEYYEKALMAHPDNPELRLMVAKSRMQAFMYHFLQAETFLKHEAYDNAIVELKASLDYDPSNRKAVELIERAKKLKQSRADFDQGIQLLEAKQFAAAKDAFLRASENDPDNPKIKQYLALFKKEPSHPYQLDRLKLRSNAPISLKFKNTPIINVFEVLTQLSGLNFIFDKDMKETKVTLFLTDVPFSRFIEVLLKTNHLAAKLINDKTIIVYPDTPQKEKEYQDLQIRTFYLADLEAKKAADILGRILKTKDITINEQLNALVVRGPKEVMDLAEQVLMANDQPQAEVLLNVEILEVSRSKEKQLGIEYNPSSITLGLGEANASIQENTGFVNSASIHALKRISSKELLLSMPTATLSMLKQDGDTRTLANPQIRVKNKEKSKIHIGERIPLRTNRRIDTTGVVTFDYQYHDIGVKLDAIPQINRNGDITLNLNLEVSALGPNLGTSEDPQYSIRTRTARSVLTVPEGDAVVIGGLISDEERDAIRRIPFIGELPVIGRLFSSSNTSAVETDIIMAITPVLIRSQKVPDPQITRIWSGKENAFSTIGPLFENESDGEAYSDVPSADVYREIEQMLDEN